MVPSDILINLRDKLTTRTSHEWMIDTYRKPTCHGERLGYIYTAATGEAKTTRYSRPFTITLETLVQIAEGDTPVTYTADYLVSLSDHVIAIGQEAFMVEGKQVKVKFEEVGGDRHASATSRSELNTDVLVGSGIVLLPTSSRFTFNYPMTPN